MQDLCVLAAPLKLDCTKEKWLYFIVLPVFYFYSVELLMGFARWHYEFMLLNNIIGGGVFPCGTSGKEATCQCRRRKRHGSFPALGRSPRGQPYNPLLYSCLENCMDREAWWTIVHRVCKESGTPEATTHK